MPVSAEVAELLGEIVAALRVDAGIGEDEAVARVNHQWGHLDLSSDDDLLLHDDAEHWAAVVYYERVPDWRPGADRTSWTTKPIPPRDCGCWPSRP